MKLRGSSYFFIVIMVIMLVIIGLSLRMEHFESKLLPLIIGTAVLILAVIGLGREILAGGERQITTTEGEATTREETGEGWRGYLFAGAWVVGFFLAIFLLGFLIAIPIFILAYMKLHGTRWLVAIAFAILTPLLIYGIFELALAVILYRGLLLSWLGY